MSWFLFVSSGRQLLLVHVARSQLGTVALIVWLAYHVVLSGFHSVSQVVVHSILLGVIAYFLFLLQASAYYRDAKRRAE